MFAIRISQRFERIIYKIFGAAFVISILAYAVHGLPLNQQYDAQVIYYARDLQQAVMTDTLGEYLVQSRKYPLLYVIPSAITQRIFYALVDLVGIVATDLHGYLLARFTTFLYAIGLFWIQWRLSKKLTGGISGALLLSFSILTFMFASAVRPHLPVAFWTLATVAASLRLFENRSAKNMFLAWGAALFAFGTLQSGIFAFIFPLWAQLRHPADWRSWAKTLPLGAGVAFLALVIGYTFAVKGIFSGQEAVSVDLGHNVEAEYGLTHGWRVLTQLLGSELILLAFAAGGIVRLFQGKGKPHPLWLPVLGYLFLFFAVFMFHSYGMSRFFLPTLPLFALLGASAFDASPRWLKVGVTVFMTVILLKLGWLALQPNTYDHASNFVKKVEGYVAIELGIPFYFTSIPDSRFPLTRESDDYQVMIMTDQAQYDPDDAWTRCAHFIASSSTDNIVLMWNDTPFALWQVLTGKMLGPNISVFCKDEF
jgi:hypothetical protein